MDTRTIASPLLPLLSRLKVQVECQLPVAFIPNLVIVWGVIWYQIGCIQYNQTGTFL